MTKSKFKTKKLINSFVLSLLILFTSCEKKEIPEMEISGDFKEHFVEYDEISSLKKEFAIALSKALEQSIPLRSFIKNEALKMFDNDYDILYQLVKDQSLSDGSTFRNTILKFYKSEANLSRLEKVAPLLTIFVPQLPENSFSADLWNISNQVPSVAIRMNNSNNVPIFESSGKEYVLPGYAIPSFPVLVVKDNERVSLIKKEYTSKRKNYKVMKSQDFSFTFLDEVFDGTIDRSKPTRLKKNRVDSKVVDAYNRYRTVDGWQRDFIYYDITPQNDRGQFSFDHQEHITKFSLNGDPANAFQKISDQSGDPEFVAFGKNSNPWTGGFFEFKVTTLINAENGVGPEITTFFSAKPEDLFVIEQRTTRIFNARYYFSVITNVKEIDLNLPIFNWDLNEYASSIKITVEEVDLTETTTITDTRSVKFATNFEIDGGFLKKIGLKFGASREKNVSQSVQRSFTQGNDELGSVIVNFGDNIITGESNGNYTFREYSTGFFKLRIEPVRVQ